MTIESNSSDRSKDVGQVGLAEAYLAAIVDSSDDAIIAKNLDGIIPKWNASAAGLFGYTPEEAIGKLIRMLIPADRQVEEDEIIARLRRGERVDHFETVRLTKEGRQVDISVTVSPIRDASGAIVGASKVARIRGGAGAVPRDAREYRRRHHRHGCGRTRQLHEECR